MGLARDAGVKMGDEMGWEGVGRGGENGFSDFSDKLYLTGLPNPVE
jgi:hypothetical protein